MMIMRFSIARPGTRALTLVEALVVIVIIGILIALLLPVLSSAKAKATRAACIYWRPSFPLDSGELSAL